MFAVQCFARQTALTCWPGWDSRWEGCREECRAEGELSAWRCRSPMPRLPAVSERFGRVEVVEADLWLRSEEAEVWLCCGCSSTSSPNAVYAATAAAAAALATAAIIFCLELGMRGTDPIEVLAPSKFSGPSALGSESSPEMDVKPSTGGMIELVWLDMLIAARAWHCSA